MDPIIRQSKHPRLLLPNRERKKSLAYIKGTDVVQASSQGHRKVKSVTEQA